VEEGFEEPMAEEAGSAGDEEVFVGEGEEGRACVGEDVGEVFGRQWLYWHRGVWLSVTSLPDARCQFLIGGR
jgi:hypothetical protein